MFRNIFLPTIEKIILKSCSRAHYSWERNHRSTRNLMSAPLLVQGTQGQADPKYGHLGNFFCWFPFTVIFNSKSEELPDVPSYMKVCGRKSPLVLRGKEVSLAVFCQLSLCCIGSVLSFRFFPSCGLEILLLPTSSSRPGSSWGWEGWRCRLF